MNKIKLLIFIVIFFLDFSFLPNLFGSRLGWPYFTLAVLTILFLQSKNRQEDMGGGVLAVVMFNMLIPFNIFGYGLIVLVIWAVMYYLKSIFFNEEPGYLKRNFSFILVFIIFGVLLFIGQNIKSKLIGEEYINLNKICWNVIWLKIVIGVISFNLIFRVWLGKESNIQVLK